MYISLNSPARAVREPRPTVFVMALLFLLFSSSAPAQEAGSTLRLTVSDSGSREPVVMATVELLPTGACTTTDAKGEAVLSNVPPGRYTLRLRYVGMETLEQAVTVPARGGGAAPASEVPLHLRMTPTSLSLSEVTVTAQQKESGASTASVVSRQAIDHLQATSLADIMQLIPGELMGNHDLTQRTNLQLRTLLNNNTQAFGSSIVVDGVPMSNNGELTQGAFSATAVTGTDLRQVSADDIDNVEIIRGIPSAEYGDLTSGLVVVHSRVGVTPWQVKAKIHPGLQNYSVGKGFPLAGAGVLNVSLDYAKAWGDPRQKTRSYDRYTASLGWGFDITKRWHADTKVRFMQAKDWSGNDPDALQDGTEAWSRNSSLTLTHNGRLRLDRPLARTLRYTVGVSHSPSKSRNTAFVRSASGSTTPILTARETGYYDVAWQDTSYRATGYNESAPGNVFVKFTDDFFLRIGKTVQTFKAGVDYRYDWNHAEGYYNADDLLPLRPNSNGRPRPFHDIPGLHQLSAFAEDQFSCTINEVQRLRVNMGLRLTSLQPFSGVATTALSPRLNVAFTATRWISLRAGIGMNSKTPGLAYLYPDKKYVDMVSANYMPQDDRQARLMNYHTVVYDVQRTQGLRNATTTKVEAGVDIRLPGNRKMSILAYRDKTPNGYHNDTEYTTFEHSIYYDNTTPANLGGLTFNADGTTSINTAAPLYTNTYFLSTGKIGNTNTTQNRGIEFDFDLGEIHPLHTNIYVSGAWSETKNWYTYLNTETPSNYLPTEWKKHDATPVKIIYPSGEASAFTRYRRFVNTLRLVTHIPRLHLVVSATGQVVWHNSTWDYNADKQPTGWIDSRLERHDLTACMMSGYIGMDGQYYDSKPSTQESIAIGDLAKTYNDTEPTVQPVTWNTSLRLTKELGRVGSLSLFVNNALFYEPYLPSNKSSTLTQRNTGTFSFGAELSLTL